MIFAEIGAYRHTVSLHRRALYDGVQLSSLVLSVGSCEWLAAYLRDPPRNIRNLNYILVEFPESGGGASAVASAVSAVPGLEWFARLLMNTIALRQFYNFIENFLVF